MHDCFPPHEAAAFPSDLFPTEEEQSQLEGWNGEWCGDVWKSIVYMKKTMSDILDVYVIDADYGLGVVRKKADVSLDRLKIDRPVFDEIDKLDYQDLMKDPADVINLTPKEVMQEIIADMKGKS